MPSFQSLTFPFILLFPLLIFSNPPPPPPLLQSNTTTAEISALISFRRSLRDPFNALSNWNSSSPAAPCSWRGVLCSPSSSRVTSLRLPRLRLSGPISSTLSSLSQLTHLSLRSNLLTGPIPSSLSHLPNLRSLFLQHNSLTGPFPSNLSSLQVFSAASNFLSGHLPVSLPSSLRFLDLSSNHFDGPVPSNFTSSAYRLRFLDLSFNGLEGTLPAGLSSLKFLLFLRLDGNFFEGTIPAVLGNFSSILYLSLQDNDFRGILPAAVAGMPSLQILSLSGNRLSGSIPFSVVFNSSAASPAHLRILQLGHNAFTELAQEDGPRVEGSSSVLQVLDISKNEIFNRIPSWVFNVSTLAILDFSGNSFSGNLPPEIGKLTALREMRIGNNFLTGPVPAEIGKCGLVRVIDLEENQFSGEVPAVIGTLYGLTNLYLGGNRFSGLIPASLANLFNLESLSLYKNRFSGEFPEDITTLSNLTFLDLSGNALTGEIPSTIGKLPKLQYLNLSNNLLSGSVPAAIGTLSDLITLDLSVQKNLSGELTAELFGLPSLKVVSLAGNSFTGNVPEGFSSLWSLEQLNLSSNSFFGSIPATYGYLPSLQILSLSNNRISGKIPPELSNCSNLTTLDLHSNYISGEIPSSLSNLFELQILDLSTNNLTGMIPSSLSLMPALLHLNLSNNNLQGEILASLGSRFDDPSAFAGNPDLCGKPLEKECSLQRRKRRRKKIQRLILLTGIVAITAIALALLCFFGVFALLRCRRRFLDRRNGVKKRSPCRGSGSSSGGENIRAPKLIMFNNKITYAETLEATRNFDEENVLSRGRHGLIFKASYNDGNVLSILRLPNSSAAETTGFLKEAESLAKLKHRNLTVLRGYYPGPPSDARLLVYDYMPNGSLATLLQEASHQDGHVLNWPMRHLIALGIARGLSHLHASGVVHGDFKPNIVLFDADFEPHVSDFGLELLASTPATVASTSVGYVAAAELNTKEGDVYSFGIVVLELLTGKGPGMFAGEEEDIVKWVKRQLQNGAVEELLVPGLFELDPESSEWEEFLLGVKVGLLCTTPAAGDRPAMADVVFMLEGCRVGPTTSSPA